MRSKLHPLLASALLFAIGTSACGSNEYAAPPPPAVTTQHPIVRDVTRYVEYTGTTEAVESVEVRARVEGFLKSMNFEPGEFVEQGSLLFVIDPEPFEIALLAARAELTSNQAELDLAQTEYDRSRVMYDQKAMSELNLLKAGSKRDQGKAAVEAARARVEAAELDLDYAHVKAPITGRVGRHRIDIGNLVGADGKTLLTNMVRYAPLYVYFHMSELDLLALQELTHQKREEAGVKYDDRAPTPVQVGRANDPGYPYEGTIDFTALEVDPSTGTFEVRGVLPNAGEIDSIIIPGTFVRVRVPISDEKGALLVTERALGSDQRGRFVLVVNSDGIVEQRLVEVGPIIDSLRLIESGLGPDDQVIVSGLQRARPGAAVRATLEAPADPKAYATPATAPATGNDGPPTPTDPNATAVDE